MSHNDTSPHPLLRISHLAKHYDGRAALHDVNLDVGAGHLVALVGHNGAGKSTLLGIVAGLIEPTDGQVRIDGHLAGSLPARAVLSYAGDNPVLYDDLSLWEHLEYVTALHGVDDWETPSRDLVKVFGLADRVDDLPSRFSRGMRQKAALAIALVRPANLVIIDEPFVGLDLRAQGALVDVLESCVESGCTIIVATHQPLFLSHVDRCIMLHDGRVKYQGPPNDDVIASLESGG